MNETPRLPTIEELLQFGLALCRALARHKAACLDNGNRLVRYQADKFARDWPRLQRALFAEVVA